MNKALHDYWNIYFRRGSFLRNLSIVMSGTAVAQIIGFVMMPVISRLFTAEDFGVFATFQSIIGVISAGITLQYIQAIVLPKEKKDAINVAFASLISVALIAVILLAVSVLFQGHVLNTIALPAIGYVYLAILASFVAGINQTFQAWCVRVKVFKQASLSQVIRSIVSYGIFLVAGIIHLGAPGLVLGTIVANIAASFNLARIFVADFVDVRKDVSRKKVMELAREYRDFPLYSTPQNLINALSQGLPVFLFGYFYDIEIAGLYAFSVRVIHTPFGLLLAPLRQVLFQKVTEVYNYNGNLFELFRKSTFAISILLFLPCVFIFIWGPHIFKIIFGDIWVESGKIASWLIVWLFVGFSNIPAVLCARVNRLQRVLLIYESIALVTRVLVLFLGGIFLSSTNTVAIFSVLGLVLNFSLITGVGIFLYYKNSNYSAVPD